MKVHFLLSTRVLAFGLLLAPSICRAGEPMTTPLYGAVGYSPSTDKILVSYQGSSRYEVESDVLSGLPRDAKVAAWGSGGWLAFALGKDSIWGGGFGYTEREASNNARAEVRRNRGTGDVIITVYTGEIVNKLQGMTWVPWTTRQGVINDYR